MKKNVVTVSRVVALGIFRKVTATCGIDAASDEFVSAAADLLGEPVDVVKTAFAAPDAKASKELFERLKKERVIYKTPDFETYKKNLTEQMVQDLAAKAKKGELPPAIYDTVKGSVLEMTEKEIAKKFGIDKWSDRDDLLNKVIAKNTGGDAVTKLQSELDAREKMIRELQQKNTELDAAAKGADEKVTAKVNELEARRQFNETFAGFKFNGERAETDRQLLQTIFDSENSLKIDNGKTVVVNKATGEVRKNSNTLEPLGIADVLKGLATTYKLAVVTDTQGRGTGTPGGNDPIVTMTEGQMLEHLKSKGIFGTPEGDKIFLEWRKANPKK